MEIELLMSKNEVLEISLDILKEKGIENLTFKVVAEQLKVQESVLVDYFENKEELLDGCIQYLCNQIITEENPENYKPLSSLMILTKRTMDSFYDFPSSFFEELSANHSAVFQTYEQFLKTRLYLAVIHYIEYGIKNNYFQPKVDIKKFATNYINFLDCALRKKMEVNNDNSPQSLMNFVFTPMIKDILNPLF